MQTLELIEELVEVPGPSGYEDSVALAISGHLEGLDGELRSDSIGNLVLRLPAPDGAPSLMLMAHMDQVGLLVKHIDADGFLYCEANGLVDERALLGSRISIWTDAGPLPGVMGIKSRHLTTEADMRTPLAVGDIWVDVGAGSAEEVADRGIDVGQPVTLDAPSMRLTEHLLVSKSVDNRAGCATLIQLAQRLAARPRDYELIFVWSTQEEVGSRGARVASQWLAPTVAVVVDTLPAGDPSTPTRSATSRVGAGPVIRVQDGRGPIGTHYAQTIRRRLVALAQELELPYQLDVYPTWTDACEVHLAGRGVPTGGVFIPRRCSHSGSEVVDLRDVERTIALLERFAADCDAETIQTLARRPAHPLLSPSVLTGARR